MESPAETSSLDEQKLFDTETLKCPYHYDRSLRAQAPVHVDPESGVYVVSTYELVGVAPQKDCYRFVHCDQLQKRESENV